MNTKAPDKKPETKKPSKWSRFVDGLGTAIGEYLFGGGR